MPRASHLVLIASVLACGFANAPRVLGEGPAVPPLLADPVAGEIGPGETQRFRIATAPDRWLTVELDQREIDLDLTVTDEAGAAVAASHSPGNWTAETVDLVTGGRHLLIAEVAAAAGADRRGGYRLRVVEHRPTRPDDADRLAARRRLREIERPSPGVPGLTPAEEEQALRDLLDGAGVAWSNEETAYLLDLLGGALAAQKRPQEAAAAFRAGLERATTGPGLTAAVELERSLGTLLAQQESFDEAAERFRRAVAAAEASGDGRTLGIALNDEARFLYSRGDAGLARARLERALEVTRAAGDAPGEVYTRSNLVRILRWLGDLEAAFAQHEEALRTAGLRNVSDSRGRLLLDAGLFYRTTGELDLALDTWTEGLELAVAKEAEGEEALLRNHLGALLCDLGEYGEARGHLERSVALAEAAANPRLLATALLGLGWADLGEGDPAKALATIEQGLAANAAADGDLEIHLLFAASIARTRLGQRDEARAVLVSLAEKAHHRGLRLFTLDAERALATVHLESGALDRAAESLAKATALATQLGDPQRQAAIESLLARLNGERGHVEVALEHAERAIEIRESVRSRLVDPDLRTSFLARWRGDFDRAIEMLMRLAAERPGAGYERRAFQLSEAAHARTLTELLAEARIDVERGISPELSRQEREAERRLAHAEAELYDLYQRPRPEPEAASRHARREARLREARDEARRLHAEVERHIRRSSPQYAELRYPQPPTVEEIQRRLPPGTALVEYALGERSSVLFVVTAEEFAAVPLAGWKTIKEAVARARPDLEKPSPLTRGRLHGSLDELSRLLLAPAAGRLATVDRLIVVPDRDLFYLPFETLPDPAAPALGPGGALRRWTISYLPSAAVLRHLEREATTWQRELLVLANPPVPALLAGDVDRRDSLSDLEGAEREARRIADLFPPQSVDLRVGAAAGKGVLTDPRVGGAARRLHIASHGVISDTDADDSYVLLAADPPHDGRLLLREVFDLDLSAELVVLSGCETALGPHVEGEGVLGFTRGFLYAGARDLVVSLWAVSDRGTEELMVELYRQILAGRPVAEALRAAKLARLADGENPFVWAPFVAFGAAPPGPP